MPGRVTAQECIERRPSDKAHFHSIHQDAVAAVTQRLASPREATNECLYLGPKSKDKETGAFQKLFGDSQSACGALHAAV